MSEEKVTLSDLATKEAAQPAPATTQEVKEPGYKTVDISAIAKQEAKPTAQEVAVASLMSDLDAAINRTKQELKENVIDVAKEKIEEARLDDDEALIHDKVEMTPPINSKSNEEDHAKQDSILDFTDSTSLSSIDDEDLNDLDDDLDDEEDKEKGPSEQDKANFETFKTEINETLKPVRDKKDLSKFKINKKPMSVTKLLSFNESQKHVSDWVLVTAQKSISFSELSGQEIPLLDSSSNNRNRINTYKRIYSTLYDHVIDANKPATLEAWVKTLPFFDIRHLYFAAYKACFERSNYIPYTCPHCKNIFMENRDIAEMVKYTNDESKAKIAAILKKDSTSGSTYETDLEEVSDIYAFAFRVPSVYNIVFENSILDEAFTQKYSDILGILAYIDDIYYIDSTNNELVPIDTKPVSDNIGKTIRRKIRIYYEILKSLNSDQYSAVMTKLRKINELASKDVEYVIPKCKCPKCEKEIPEESKDPADMLFTRHQLVAIANM